MRVEVSAVTLQMPEECACCGAPPDADLTISAEKSWGKRVIHSEAKTWDIPYCCRCLEHSRRRWDAGSFARTATVTSLVVALFVGYLTGWYWGLGLGITLIVLTIVYFRRLLRRAESFKSSECTSLHQAVSYVGWSGTLHSFEMKSKKFAHHFMLSNQNKLVNLTSEGLRLLSLPRTEIRASSRRSPRRYLH